MQPAAGDENPIVIEPLPAKAEKKEAAPAAKPKAKGPRKLKKPEPDTLTDLLADLLPPRPKAKKTKMTPARKKAMERARAKSDAAQEATQKLVDGAMDSAAASLPSQPEAAPAAQMEPHLDSRIGQLENQIRDLNENMLKFFSSGSFQEKGQAQQTLPQQPTELRHRNMMQPEESFYHSSNGGETRMKVAPDRYNEAPVPMEPTFNYPGPMYF